MASHTCTGGRGFAVFFIGPQKKYWVRYTPDNRDRTHQRLHIPVLNLDKKNLLYCLRSTFVEEAEEDMFAQRYISWPSPGGADGARGKLNNRLIYKEKGPNFPLFHFLNNKYIK